MPSFYSGLGASLGAATETTYGTGVAVDHFYEFENESVQLTKEFLLSSQLRAGRMFQSSSRRIATTRAGGGTIAMEVPNKGFGLWLNQLHGNTVTPVVQGATTAYLQTHNIGTTDPFSKSCTVQIGRPDVGGVIRPFTYPGSKVTGLQFSAATGAFLTTQITLDSQDETTGTPALATPVYPTGLRSFTFTQGVVTIDGVNAALVSSATLTISEPQATDRYFLGNTGLKGRPIVNGYFTADLQMTVDFADLTYYNKFTSGAISTVVLDFIGPVIAGAFNEEIKITLSAVGWNGDTPNAAGPDILQQNVPVVVLDDGTNPPVQIAYTSTDTVI